MALAGDNLRSIDGRKFGRTPEGYHRSDTGLAGTNYQLGAAGSEYADRGAAAVGTASTGSTIGPGGITSLAATTAAAFTMAAPVPGLQKRLISNSSSTGQTVTLVSGTFRSTAGSSQNMLTFVAGTGILLEAISTAIYAVLGHAGVTFSTA